MIVVADSSPLIVLVNIGHIEILSALFGEVFIPPQIAAELSEASVHSPSGISSPGSRHGSAFKPGQPRTNS